MTLTDRLNGWLSRLSLPGPAPSQIQEARLRLIGCLPPALQRALVKHHRVLVVHAEGDQAALELITGFEKERIGDIDILHSLSLPAAITERSREQRHTTELRLPADAVLRRTVSFPAQVRTNLPQVVRYELDRLTPFQPEEVVFDFAPQTGPKNANRLNLDLAVCRRDLIETWVERMRSLDSPLDRVTWPGAWTGANLLPPEHRPITHGVRFGLSTLLALVVVLLAVAVLITPLWQKQQVAKVLDTELTDARKQAIAVDELRQELERARQGSTLVLQKKLDQPPLLSLLQELTDRLPEDTWIQNMEVNGDQVDIRGESGQATALIAILEQAPGIDGVSFRSPVTQIARTGKERFNISFSYVRQRDE